MRNVGPSLRVVADEDDAEPAEVEVEWSKITFPDLQDLLFPGDSESESEEEESDREGVKRLQSKAKGACKMLLEKKHGLFPDGKMTGKLDYQGLAELEFVWSQITPQEFVMTLYAMGPEAKQMDYMNSLLVEVDPALLPRKQQKHVHNITMLYSAASAVWSEQREPESWPHFDATQPGLIKNCSLWDRMAVLHVNCCGIRYRELEVVHRFAYTTATSLFTSKDPRDQAYVLKALADAGRSSLGTPLGRALMLDAWLDSRWEFIYELTLAVCYLSLFLRASVKIRRGYVPSVYVLFPLFGLSMWTVFIKVVETATTLKLFRSLYVMSTSLMLMFLELYNAATVLFLFRGTIDQAGEKCIPPECLLMSHLTSLSLSIFLRWAHLISSMLCLRIFGERVLPAAYTMCSPESVRFLIVIGMLVIASFSAYWVFPIPGTVPMLENQNASTWDYLVTEFQKFHIQDGQFLVPQQSFSMLMKMFNLDLMGAFDLMDLEGKSKVVRLNASAYLRLLELRPGSHVGRNQTITLADIIDPAPEDTVHQGVSVLLIVLCVFVNVIIMNIYIGLLSSVYETYSTRRWELLAEYKTIHVLRGKLSNPFKLLSYFGCSSWLINKCCRGQPANRAIWLAFRDEEFPAEEGADTAVVLARLDGIDKNVQQLVDRRT